MSIYILDMSADASTLLANVTGKDYEATVGFTGGFGGGTVAIQASYDGGTTKTTVAALDGTTPVSTNAAKSFAFKLGSTSNSQQPIKLYATLTGSTTPTLKVSLADNRG